MNQVSVYFLALVATAAAPQRQRRQATAAGGSGEEAGLNELITCELEVVHRQLLGMHDDA